MRTSGGLSGLGASGSANTSLSSLGTRSSGSLGSSSSLSISLGGLSTSGSLSSLGSSSGLSARSSGRLLSACEADLKIVEPVRAETGGEAKVLNESLVECASASLDRERLAANGLATGVTTLLPVYTSRWSADDLISTVGSSARLAAVERLGLDRSVLRASSLSGGGRRSRGGSGAGLGSRCKSSDSLRGCDARQSCVGGSGGLGLARAGVDHGDGQGSQDGREDLCGRHLEGGCMRLL